MSDTPRYNIRAEFRDHHDGDVEFYERIIRKMQLKSDWDRMARDIPEDEPNEGEVTDWWVIPGQDGSVQI